MSDLERMPSLPDSGGGADSEQAVRLLRLVWRGKWLLLILPLLGAGLTYAYYDNLIGSVLPQFKVVPRYRATSNLLVEVKTQNPITGQVEQTTAPRTTLNRQERLFVSQAVLKPLSEIPEIQQLPSVRRQGSKTVTRVLSDFLRARVDDSQDRLSVSYEAPRKEDAILVVDKAVEVYQDFHARANRERVERDVGKIEVQKVRVDDELDALQQAWTDARQEYGITGTAIVNPLEASVGGLRQTVREATRELTTAQVRKDEAEANTDTPEAMRAFGERLRTERTNTVLEAEIERYEAEKKDKQKVLAERIAEHGEESPQLAQLRKEIEVFEGLIDEVYARYAQNELAAATSAVTAAERALERHKAELAAAEEEYFSLEQGLGELQRLAEKRELLLEDRRKFSDLIAQLSSSQDIGGLYTTVIDSARATSKPVYPETQTYMLYGAVGGFLLACGLVALRGFTDRRVWSPEEVPGMLGASVVGVLPTMSSKKPDKVGQIVHAEPGSLAAEAVRSVRTATTFALGDDGRGVVLLTSSVSGEGKSISSSNLALAFAQSGRKTLLVDADLRKPGQNAIFNLIGKRGLGDAIVGDVSWQNAVVQKVVGDLDLLPAGAAERGPAEILESSACRALFAELRREYDVVVIDSSPVLETAETRVLSTIADVCLFVMRIDVSTAPSARRAVGILHSVDAHLIGVFLNGASPRRGAKAYAEGISYGYGMAYGGGYGYGGAYGAQRGEQPPEPRRKRASEGSVEAWS